MQRNKFYVDVPILDVKADGRVSSPVKQRRAILKFPLLLLGLLMTSLGSSHVDAGHLEVVRELRVETGQGITPYAIAQTHEGGYVVTGMSYGLPWATRVDAAGKVQWQHILKIAELRPGGPSTFYDGVAILPDDSAVLCGFKIIEPNGVSGLLTHIDKTGQAISERSLQPNVPGGTSALSYLQRCMPWGDGAAVVGHALRWFKPGQIPMNEELTWVLALDSHADIKWEKLYPFDFGPEARAVVTSDGDLVTESWGLRIITRIDPAGAVKNKSSLPAGLVRPIQPEAEIYAVSYPDSKMVLHQLGAQLEELGRVTGKAVTGFHNTSMYRMKDGALVLFGYQRGPENRAAVRWISPDLNRQETLLLDPYWIVADAIPTGSPGEFAVVSQGLKHPESPILVITLLRVK